jgi:TonB family protein
MHALAEKRRREMEAQEAEAARAAAAAASPQSTLVVPPRKISEEMAAAQTPSADKLGAARSPDPADRAIAFASAMGEQKRGDAAPPPAKKKSSPLPLVIGGVVVLALAAVGVWKYMDGQKQEQLAQCNANFATARDALAAGDLAAAEAAIAPAREACTGTPQYAPLVELATEVSKARTQEQACVQGETQATAQLDQGQPALARTALDGLRATCATRPAFAALDTRAQGAEAEAKRLFAEAAAQFNAGDVAAADASLKQALAADANLADTQLLRSEIDKRLAKMAPPAAAPAETPATAATTPAKPPEPKPAEPKPTTTAPATPTAALPPPPPPKPAPVTPTPTPAPTPATTAPAPPPPAPVATTPPPEPTPAPARSSRLVPVSTPQPPYPPEAARASQKGQVIATFTVNTDGSVGNVRIVKSTPRGVFDGTVKGTVARWRFQPLDESRDVTQTFTFAQ